jgi:hypothetical protein
MRQDSLTEFSVPLNILGGSRFRWPETPSLDRSTRDEIVRSEAGDETQSPMALAA